jgi:hypothetical protein
VTGIIGAGYCELIATAILSNDDSPTKDFYDLSVALFSLDHFGPGLCGKRVDFGRVALIRLSLHRYSDNKDRNAGAYPDSPGLFNALN